MVECGGLEGLTGVEVIEGDNGGELFDLTRKISCLD